MKGSNMPSRKRNSKLKSKLEAMKSAVVVPQQQPQPQSYRMEIPLHFTRIRTEDELTTSDSQTSRTPTPSSDSGVQISSCGDDGEDGSSSTLIERGGVFIRGEAGRGDAGRGLYHHEDIVDEICMTTDDRTFVAEMNRQSSRTATSLDDDNNKNKSGASSSFSSRKAGNQYKSAATTNGGDDEEEEEEEEDDEEDLLQAFRLGVIDGDEEIPGAVDGGQKKTDLISPKRTTDETVSRPKTIDRRRRSAVAFDDSKGKEKFPCPHCPKASTTKHNLKRHIGTVHAKILAEMNAAVQGQKQNNQPSTPKVSGGKSGKKQSDESKSSSNRKQKQAVKTSSPKPGGGRSPPKPKPTSAVTKKQAYSDKYHTYLSCLSESQTDGQEEEDRQPYPTSATVGMFSEARSPIKIKIKNPVEAIKESGSEGNNKKKSPNIAKIKSEEVKSGGTNKSNGRGVDENGNPVKRKYNKPPLVHSCDFCNAEFKSNSNLRRHEREAHADEQPTNQCQFCPLFFFHVNQYRKHLQRDHRDRMTVDDQPIQREGKKPIKKEVRDKAINEMVTKQEKAPEPELPEFYCNECNRGFKTEMSYKYHRDYHKSIEAGLPYQFSGGPGTTPTIHRMGTTASTVNNIEPILPQYHETSSLYNEAPKSVTAPPPSTPIRCFSGGKPAAMLNMMPSPPRPAPLTTGTSTVMNRVKRNKQMPVTRVVSTGNFVPSSIKAGGEGEQMDTASVIAGSMTRQNLKRKLKIKSASASFQLSEENDKWGNEESSSPKRAKSDERKSSSSSSPPSSSSAAVPPTQPSSLSSSAAAAGGSHNPHFPVAFNSPSPLAAIQNVQTQLITRFVPAEDAGFYNNTMIMSSDGGPHNQTRVELFGDGSSEESLVPVPLIVPAEPKFRCPHCRMERFHHRFELDFHVRTCEFSPANRVSASR